ncbi:MAG: hypothetical protein GY950_22845 [bacterium]|nr:hypothetical protein [bacterium]
MHQPYYRNPYTGKLELPWVRLHALKDYYGMVRILKDFPRIKATYNLVPSLLVQLEGYLKGRLDIFQEVFKKDAQSLNPKEVGFLTRHFFSANYDNLIKPYPRYDYLFNKREKRFSTDELRDLQVWFSLCYFDEEYKDEDERIRGLIEKGQHFTEADKAIIEAAELELLGKIIPEYKAYADSGQIEICTTPFYHPILPLLLDPQQGRAANPDLPRYPLHFSWPGDAAAQLESALAYMEKTFGRRPAGIWPSEGSLSQEVLGMLDGMGAAWTATDELNLSQSLSIPIERDGHFTVKNPSFLYKPYVLAGGRTRIFFRDHHLSDLIGFHYQKMDPGDAARDLLERIKAVPGGLVVPIILDGENAWEYYHKSGRGFLREFFGLLEGEETIETVTFSECLEMEPGVIEHFSAGSWINGNFDIWIGDEEDRKGWQLIEEARNAFERKKETTRLSKEQKREILEYIHIAEGSDWFWWFGKENYTPDLHIFDHLLRKNLQKVYDLLGVTTPAELFTPVSGALKKAEIDIVSPKSYITPEIDGRVGNYFEWLNAGSIDVVSGTGGAMAFSNSLVTGLFYGFDAEHLYLRVDTPQEACLYFERDYTLEIIFIKDKEKKVLDLKALNGKGDVAIDTVIECKMRLDFLSVKEGDSFHLYLEWKSGGEFFQTIPGHGYFTLTVPTEKIYSHFWLV